MKKIMLIPALMLSVSLMAENEKYEITSVIGYNFVEDNLAMDGAVLYGAEVQYNGYNSDFKPELSVLYSDVDYKNTNLSTDIYRMALNAVYEYDKVGSLIPIAKVGIGYETIKETYGTQNSDGAFLDAGIGAKIELAKNIALKLEAVYMLKDGVKGSDNSLATLIGLNFAFGGTTPSPYVEPTPKEVVVTKPVIVQEETKTIPVGADDDQDGILNSIDKCPQTPPNQVVDQNGCMLLVNLHINFKTNSYTVDTPSETNIDAFANFLKVKTNYNAKIVGHTDSRGRASYNKTLSINRADEVKKLLVQKGISAQRILSYGMGEDMPIADNTTKEGRSKNRRIEATLIKN